MNTRLPFGRTMRQFSAGAVLLASIGLSVWTLAVSGAVSGDIPLSPGSAPAVIAERSYLNRAFLTTHTTRAFDSTGGDLIVVCASSHATVRMTPSDSLHNTWISAAGPTNTTVGMNLRTAVWYAKGPVVGRRQTFTLELSEPQSLVISLFVVRGADRASPIDAISPIGDDGGSQTPEVNSPAVTTTASDDLLLGFAKSSASEIWHAGPGYTSQTRASSDYLVGEIGWALAPGQYNSSFDVKSPATWQSAVLAVRPAARISEASHVSSKPSGSRTN